MHRQTNVLKVHKHTDVNISKIKKNFNTADKVNFTALTTQTAINTILKNLIWELTSSYMCSYSLWQFTEQEWHPKLLLLLK